MRAVLLLGTKKGVFLAESDAQRENWEVCGPLTSGTWAMYHVGFGADGGSHPELLSNPGDMGSGGDPRGSSAGRGSSDSGGNHRGGVASDRTIYAGGASNWYGPAIWQSRDVGQTWTHSSEGLTYGNYGPEISQVWCVTPAHGALYAGVEPAGLFRSDDGGVTWQHVSGLRDHPSRPEWRATSGGLCLHTILAHPDDPQQLWVGISSGGVFHTHDGGSSWSLLDHAQTLHPCVHALALTATGRAASADSGRTLGCGVRLYQQNHHGVYRSDDGGQHWLDISQGLPSRFGFPLVVHPRDPQTLYVVPLESDEPGRRHVPGGQMAVWRSRDGGGHWQALTSGLPRERTSLSVLRGALAVDTSQPAGVYLGTATGQVYWSADQGDTWRAMPARLPPIYSIAAMPV